MDDADVVRALATAEPRVDLLADERTIFVAAFEDGRAVGFALGYLLPRRHGDATVLFVYEVDVAETHRRRGIASGLLRRLREEAPGDVAFVLTEPENRAANELYRSLGGEPQEQVLWRFRG